MYAGSTRGTLRCVRRSDIGSCSSGRRSDRACSSIPRRSRRRFQDKAAARTAFVSATGSTPSRQQASPLRFHSKGVSGSRAQLAARRRLDTANRSTSHVKRPPTHDGRLESVGPRPARGTESGCAVRLLRPTRSWVFGFPRSDKIRIVAPRAFAASRFRVEAMWDRGLGCPETAS
jgi:hypothetical protein